MPVTAARFETGRRPGFFSRRGLVDGSNGSISVHNSSPMIGLAISSVSAVSMPEVSSSPRKLTALWGLVRNRLQQCTRIRQCNYLKCQRLKMDAARPRQSNERGVAPVSGVAPYLRTPRQRADQLMQVEPLLGFGEKIQDADLQHRRRAASAYPAGHNLSETWSLLIEVSVFARLFEQQNDPHRLHKIHATRCIDGEVSEIP